MTERRLFFGGARRLCIDCGREWLSARVLDEKHEGRAWNADTDGCPACGGRAFTQPTYNPAFPGGDIPRNLALLDAQPAPDGIPDGYLGFALL
jgi:hypothetical protein